MPDPEIIKSYEAASKSNGIPGVVDSMLTNMSERIIELSAQWKDKPDERILSQLFIEKSKDGSLPHVFIETRVWCGDRAKKESGFRG